MGRVTLRDVAERAGVSTATVSNALNRPHLLSRTTLQRVQTAISATGYVGDDTAKQLRVGTSRSIGVLVPDTGNPFYAELIRSIDDAAARHGLYVLLSNSNDNPRREAEYVQFMRAQRARGLIFAPSSSQLPEAIHTTSEEMAVVILGEPRTDLVHPSVSGDDTRGGALAATHLLDRGRRRIAFVAGPLSVPQLANRLTGAQNAVRDADGGRLDVIETKGYAIADGVTAAEHLLSLPPSQRPDAIQAGNDMIALGILQRLIRDGGVLVPDDLAIIGYDDSPLVASVAVPLSSIRHPTPLMGRTAVDLLLDELAQSPAAGGRHLVFLPELVERESTSGRLAPLAGRAT